LRKYDLRAYVALIRKEDDIYNSKWYMKATLSMIKGLQAYQDYLPEVHIILYLMFSSFEIAPKTRRRRKEIVGIYGCS